MSRRTLSLGVVLVFLLAIGVGPAASDSLPSGERMVGKAKVEPAYNDETGQIIYLLTPTKAPLPAPVNGNAISPLYLVEYPPGWSGSTLNCEGVPGNCPTHGFVFAAEATGADPLGVGDSGEPSVYGTVPGAVPGHDHLVDPPGAPDFNVAWEVVEVLWTPAGVAHYGGVANLPHLTTDDAVEANVDAGYAREIDAGFSFYCAVVSGKVYERGTPLG